jgi:hypothetical protein
MEIGHPVVAGRIADGLTIMITRSVGRAVVQLVDVVVDFIRPWNATCSNKMFL